MKVKNTFLAGKMNKQVDERLVPQDEYRDALNIDIATSDGADVGAIENVRGNELLSSLNLTNAETLGAYADTANQLIYWFVTSNESDGIYEYNIDTGVVDTVLLSSLGGVLDFSSSVKITGINKILNSDTDKDLLMWTDNINPPRKVNIARGKTYGLDGFIEDDISVIKKPPRKEPITTFTTSADSTENNIEDKFLK